MVSLAGASEYHWTRRPTRNYGVKCSQVRLDQAQGNIMVVKIKTEDNVADLFTKEVRGGQFRKLAARLLEPYDVSRSSGRR